MFLCNLITPVCGASKAEAEDKMALIGNCRSKSTRCRYWRKALNFDFGAKGIDEPLTTEELQGMQGMLGIRDGVLKYVGQDQSDARAISSPSRAAARRKTRWWVARRKSPTGSRRCSSIVAATALWSRQLTCRARMPTSSATSCRNCSGAACSTWTIPGKTLRENLGLRRPAAGAWKTEPRAAAE